jgi:D-alanyl-D-alanine carboxypeptidase
MYQRRFQAKTGTLKGIATFAGYMLSPQGKPYPFVIMLLRPYSGVMRKNIANQLYQGIFSQISTDKL